jgi:hypothetical protein
VRALIVALALLSGLACAGCAVGQTGTPSSVGARHAIVNGTFATNVGGTVQTWFEYGTTTAYGSATQHHTQTLDPGFFHGGMGDLIDGLQRNTVYHYRACASDSKQQGGPGCGADRTFKTQPVDCGDTVTTDIRLTGNLGSCSGQFALKVGADGVDIDLGGYNLNGSFGPNVDPIAGIVNEGHDDVTVRNGTLSGFNTAFCASDASRNRLRNVNVQGLGVGAAFVGGADNEIRHSKLQGALNGALRATGSPRLVLADSDVEALFFDAGALIQSDDARIVRNRFLPIPGLDYEDRLPALKLTGNRAHIGRNQVSGVWSSGFVLSGSDNVVVDNKLSGLFGDGIFVSPFSARTLLRGNLVDGMADDGFDVQSPSTRLGANSATGNGDWGIDAVPGVTDLGGNTASGNGQAAQCRNVACAP